MTRLWPIVLRPCHLEYRSDHERFSVIVLAFGLRDPSAVYRGQFLTRRLTALNSRSIGQTVSPPLRSQCLAASSREERVREPSEDAVLRRATELWKKAGYTDGAEAGSVSGLGGRLPRARCY